METILDAHIDCSACGVRMKEVNKISRRDDGSIVCAGWCDTCHAQRESKPVELTVAERKRAQA
ncbi:MAG TPA: hypothetical protein VIL74_08950 [Pyrinomonadaceae bacterium]|jgi:hypothetical protein